MAISDDAQSPSPSDRAGETPADPALAATASVEDGPLDFDSELLAIAAAPAVSPVLRPEPGDEIGVRYRIERQLGEGGMGAVYLAHDIELERKVAVKLQSRPASASDLERLQREAKAMARLNHPNVVGVHEVGTHEGHVFIAMEYVQGTTAREWIRGKPGWLEVVELLAATGGGLAAAHEVGIIHRDFKPENVMVGGDGRPRIGDFGLARDSPTRGPKVTAAALGDGKLTVTGAVLGTPAYMSPEQFAGEAVGTASDQFSFCVMAYEALFGRRPFRGRNTSELATAVADGDYRAPPKRAGPPAMLVRAVVKGLSPAPSDRHASMAALVDRLESVLRARRRRVWLGVAGVVAVVGSGLGYQAAFAIRPEPCEGVEEALGSAWDEQRRGAVAQGHSEDTVAALDVYARGWGLERRAACEATSVRGERSELELSLRMACLDRHAARLDGLTSELAERHGEAIANVEVEALLPPIAECRDVDQLERLANRHARRSTRSSTEQDAAALEANRLAAAAQARVLLGANGATELARQARDLAREHGLAEVEYRALIAQAEVARIEGDENTMQQLRSEALELATAAGQPAGAAEVVLRRVESAVVRHDLSAAAAHMSYFEVFASQVVDEEARRGLSLRAEEARGHLAIARGDFEAAITAFESLLPHPDVMVPYVLQSNLGRAYLQAGRHSDAIVAIEKAIELRGDAGGRDDLELANLVNNLASAHLHGGDADAAAKGFERAHAMQTKAAGDQRAAIGATLSNWGTAERLRGNLRRARELQSESMQLVGAARGESHASLAYATDELGELSRIEGDLDAALGHLQHSIRLREPYGAEHPLVAESLTRMGHVYLDRGEAGTAAEVLGAAIGILEKRGTDANLAEAKALLARASE